MTSLEDIKNKPHVYSWSTKVDFEINSVGGFKDFTSDPIHLEWGQSFALTLERRDIHPLLEAGGTSGYRLVLDATQTACEAEELGKRLACALLKFAVDRNWGLRLAWQDTPLPCRVIDRTASRGIEGQGFASVREEITLSDFANKLDDAFSTLSEVPYRILLSMELCASARFETDNRAKLILLVSAIEALAEQRDLSEELGEIIPSLVTLVESNNIQDENLKNSIIGQIGNLRRESSRRAIARMLQDANVPTDDVRIFEEVYSARSKIVHEGLRVPELTASTSRLDGIIRTLYADKLRRLQQQDRRAQ